MPVTIFGRILLTLATENPPSLTHPTQLPTLPSLSRFPIPDSRFPIPDSRFPC
ncbi:MAG: hypothetical protein F6J90_25465 [Moorea sp. SIOASIH]|uniref:hypothetical protein n=1 Tax=Moorena sp. SIOASIH TaxID=2607817 RepID=UPI0013B5DEA2|nr:hypothetical protein [Moorena sp. SIOASIH]NEO39498.1 hypothetical protein [Moorena sp. SIOASIH]